MKNLKDYINKNKDCNSFKKSYLKDNEEIISLLWGSVENSWGGHLFLTNLRVIFYRKGMITSMTRSIPIDKISSIDIDKGIVYNKIVFHTSNDEIDFQQVSNSELQYPKSMNEILDRFHSELEKLRNAKIKSSQGVKNTVNNDPMERIRKLKELKDEGLINEKEFEEKKKKLLDVI